ncbi:hypothetical protein [Lyngbya sp. CCY1209]|uniref:hypothetical protein n=1 Tax=Lyngbya sp. CCY1209 TaxID=2886103 RepID=UPI002D20FEDA|nr:hypothetical protein [Lyngbya sp. CCY1209]MEB3886900.1 hypothetical protein [Lyngbya sp. CCY1209]
MATPVFAQSGCDRAYPQTISGREICIPPPPPDLDCPDLPRLGIREPIAVSPPDPHRFDRDRDGIGCETLR